jgi:hypothetical protein
MKKLVYLLIGVSLLLALVPAVASADEITVDLIAGQTDTIGTVEVWNDADYLYVKFVSDGDCLLETHVAVETDWHDIPQTKKGNPIPGQFEYSDPHACVQEYTYEIPLTWAIDTELYIAAHAATGVKTSMWVSSDGNESFTAYTGPGTASYPCEPGAARSGTAVATWQHSAWGSVTSQFTYGTWIWEAYRAVDPICGTVVDFEETFDIPGEFTDGTLWVTADNGYEAYLNGTLLETDGLSGDWRNSDLTESYVTTAQAAWSSIEIATWLQLTGNTLRFETANEYFNTDDGHGSAGTVDSNPGGLIYEAEITYYTDGETAWGDGTEFPGKNWGMYFTYTVQAVCPSIAGSSDNIELLDAPPVDVSVGSLESDEYVRVWQEFVGPLAAPLEYDLEEGRSAKEDGPSGEPLEIAAGQYVCSYYVHLDNVGPSSTVQKTGYVQFDTKPLGLIISGGNLGTFAGKDLMFAADDDIGYSGTIYPDDDTPYPPNVNYLRGFDVNYGENLDDAVFNGSRVDFTMWVVNAHDSFRIILPALP